jgi:hypothetical protein
MLPVSIAFAPEGRSAEELVQVFHVLPWALNGRDWRGQETDIALRFLRPGWFMAHVMHAAGLFPSVSEARRNGWAKPISSGLSQQIVGKRRAVVTIYNP